MERSLSNALPFFEEAAKESHLVLFAYDTRSHRFLYLNPAFELYLKKPAKDLVANPVKLLQFIHEEERAYITRAYEDILKGVKKPSVQFRLHISGETRWIDIRPYLVNGVIVGSAEDISHLKEKEYNMQEYAARKDSVLEILSHDLAGPLANIQSIAQLMAKELKDQDLPFLDKLVSLIETTSERSIRLIREFVKQEFLESQKSEFVKDRIDLISIMREVVDQYMGSEKNIQKKFFFATSHESIYVKMDVYKFMQVINNLVSNAIKFTRDGGEIRISVENREDTVLIAVADDGIGIPKKYHDQLFNKFTKARRPGIKGEPSVGLGMSIIKTIVEWHSGRIWFESEENVGSTFYIELPKE